VSLVKALLITHFFKKISDEERDQWSAGGVGGRLEAAIQSLLDSPDNTVLAKAGIEPGALWNGVFSLRGFVRGGKKDGKKGGTEKHRRAALVRVVLSACYRSQASEEAQAAFDGATAPARLETVLLWLEEGGVGAAKAVEEAGIPKKAMWKGISSMSVSVKEGSAKSTRYKCNSRAKAVWCAYVKHVGEGPLSQIGNPCLLVNLQEVSAYEAMSSFGDRVVERLDRLPSWNRQVFGHSVVSGRANETAFAGSASAYQVRGHLGDLVEQVIGERPTKPDLLNKMATVVQPLNPHWIRPSAGSFAGNKSQRKAAADKYVRDAYNDLARQEHSKFVAKLTLATRVDMVVLCLLTWYQQLTLEMKKRVGQTGSEVHY
jgi:hypothetical protein